MTFSRRTLSILTVLILLTVMGGGIWWRLQPEGEGDGEAQASTTDTTDIDLGVTSSQFSTEIPAAVEGAEVVQDTLWIRVSAAGRAAANRQAVVTAQVEGVVQSVPVRENSAVTGGQSVVQIDTTELAMELARAEAQLANAQAAYDARMLALGGADAFEPAEQRAREQVVRATSGLADAEVAVRQARTDLERASVAAPFGGRVADLQVVEGQYVSAGTELMTVVDLNPIRVEASVLEQGLGLLTEGRRASVRFTAFPEEVYDGRIASINPMVDAAARTARVTVLIGNADGRIKPGMYADVSLEAQAFPDRILVPRSAILERGEARERDIVFVYQDDGSGTTGAAEWRYVTRGRENETHVEILESEETDMVQPGEVVLTDGHHYLAHDTRVQLVENAAVAGGRPGR